MCPSQAILWSCLVILTTPESSAFLLNDHSNASMGHPDNANYNIYSKIDALDRTLQNLETTVREKTTQLDRLETTVREKTAQLDRLDTTVQEKTTHSDTLMRQVLLTVTEIEVKMKTSDFQLQNMSLQIEKLENSSGKYQLLILIVYAFLIYKNMYFLLVHTNTVNLFPHYLHINASVSSHISNYLYN